MGGSSKLHINMFGPHKGPLPDQREITMKEINTISMMKQSKGHNGDSKPEHKKPHKGT